MDKLRNRQPKTQYEKLLAKENALLKYQLSQISRPEHIQKASPTPRNTLRKRMALKVRL